MVCDARIRPFPNETEVACDLHGIGEHSTHRGVVRDYAYPGSTTTIEWQEDDRRTFHGEWPGSCTEAELGCVLPRNHRGRHATATGRRSSYDPGV